MGWSTPNSSLNPLERVKRLGGSQRDINDEIVKALQFVWLPRSFLSGLEMSQDSDVSHDTLISVGECKDSEQTSNLVLKAAITKQIDVDWAERDDNGGFPSALTLAINTWYHVFVIGKSANQNEVDAGFDTSLTAVNLLNDAAEYNIYRRIGSVLTDGSSNIRNYKMYGSGRYREFWHNGRLQDFSDAPPVAIPTIITLTRVPPGVETLAIMTFLADVGATITTIRFSFGPVSATVGAGSSDHDIILNSSAEIGSIHVRVPTNTSQQIEYDFSLVEADLVIEGYVHGWQEML